MRLVLPRLYVILDAALLPYPEPESAVKLAGAGVRLMQYRNKSASTRELFASAQALGMALRERGATFIVNDRADVAALAGVSGTRRPGRPHGRAGPQSRRRGSDNRHFHAQPRASARRGSHVRGLHRGRAGFSNGVESGARSRCWFGTGVTSAPAYGQTHRSDWGHYAGARSRSDRSRGGLRGRDQRYSARERPSATSAPRRRGFGVGRKFSGESAPNPWLTLPFPCRKRRRSTKLASSAPLGFSTAR